MPEIDVNKKEKYLYTQNRELSWLRFNQRVLEEAGDKTVPLLERLKFISIFSSNLDEFFMVRVGSLVDIDQISPDEIDNKSGMTSSEQLIKIFNTIPGLLEQKRRIYTTVMQELKTYGIHDLEYSELREEERKRVDHYFSVNLLPMLSPMVIGSHHPVPHLVNKDLYIAVLLTYKKGKHEIGLVPVPDSLPPYLSLSKDGRFIRLENIIMQWAPELFGAYTVTESCVISVTRNADLSFDKEKFEDYEDDFRSRVLTLLKKRKTMSVVRLELDRKISDNFHNALKKMISVKPNQIYVDFCPLNMKYVYQLADELGPMDPEHLLYEPYTPRWPEDISQKHPMIEQIRQRDRMLFFPFDSVDPFLQLLNEAADRPDVVSIKITIYRLASTSKIAQILCRAAENGKEVLAIMELRARFDEANNISWSKLMEDAGCQIIYGIEDYKCHSKICLITMRNRGKISYITQIGTGNYNEKTNAMYTDLSLMTANEKTGADATLFFQNMLVNNLHGNYQKLLVSPVGIKQGILTLLDEEIAKGTNGYVCIKANSVTEREVIDKLRDASRAGVEIQLIIRGICCILPGIPAQTDHIHVTSIVGRYLEHARIYCFGRGDEAKLFISSADLMTRNLNRRVEIAYPVYDEDLRRQLQEILTTELNDNVKASFMQPDGTYSRKLSQPGSCSSQDEFMKKSLHNQSSLIEPKPIRPGFFARLRKALLG